MPLHIQYINLNYWVFVHNFFLTSFTATPFTEDYGEFEGEAVEETGSIVAETDDKKDVDKKKKKKKKKK